MADGADFKALPTGLGSGGGSVVDAKDVKRLARDLREAAGKVEGGKLLRAAHKDTAKVAEEASRGKASGGTAQQSSAASAIAAQGLQTSAVLQVRNMARIPYGIGAFVGAKRWPQFPAWVGNQYEPGASPSQGPYRIREALYETKDKVAEVWHDNIAHAMREAGLHADEGPLRKE